MIKQALRYLLDVLEAKDTPTAAQGVDDLDAVLAAFRNTDENDAGGRGRNGALQG